MPDMVTLTLAHPLTKQQAERLHAKDDKDYQQGDKIMVPQEDGRAIINAGYAAGIEPTDHEAVHKALYGSAPKPTASK